MAQEGSLGHTGALGTHFPTDSLGVSRQMFTCTGRGDTSVTPGSVEHGQKQVLSHSECVILREGQCYSIL